MVKCKTCNQKAIGWGKVKTIKRFYCKCCKTTFLEHYEYKAYEMGINKMIVNLTKEGCGIRSISRLLNISTQTVISRIKTIANGLKAPIISLYKTYEVDELKTFVGSKTNEQWLIYSLERESRRVVNFKIGKRTKKNIQVVTDSLLLAKPLKIYTDGLGIYKSILPQEIHRHAFHQINYIERKNLSLRTHLKRLSRKSISLFHWSNKAKIPTKNSSLQMMFFK
ncbi:IS1 family transposase [Pedobacter cryophilus]|uniref:IS1 family transposase n=1 Tax=Pedobacter cryophilus TaxID=2571271 RepID=A0A4V5NXF7_9SPHI|nr:IS1 family transposase [Pedobacter cryophilus]TKB99093.1 IS1 family transposase [Pedobacter cryophilus]